MLSSTVYSGGKLTSPRHITFGTDVSPDLSYDKDRFLKEVSHYVQDPAGWSALGFTFTYTDKPPEVLFKLVPNEPRLLGLSLSHPHHHLVEINAKNWIHGVKRTRLTLDGYRQYVISHELGHMLGCEHSNPPAHGQPVPVMHQQSRLGVEGYIPNNKVDITVVRPMDWVSDIH